MRVKPSRMGLVPYIIKEAPSSFTLFLPREDTRRGEPYAIGKRSSSEPDHAGTLILDP